ncbi:MAG TPA: family 10 glycosylhydrolase [Longimicrobium sp.]|nr:family 10 glycosylhydrolase [Longimicrobium sp.]
MTIKITRRTLPASLAVLLLGAAMAGARMQRHDAPPEPAAPAVASRLAAAAAAPAVPVAKPPLEEARALWVNRWDYGSAATIAQVMEVASRANFNIVYFQVRGPSDARYRSALDPCSPRLCGRLGGVPTWDPLEVAIREAHARGLQLHAWINALSGWESRTAGECNLLQRSVAGQPNHVLIDHPEWAMHTRRGRPQACPNGEEYVYLSPGHPGVRTHLARVAADVVRRYEVDGVHLDRIRYPDAGFGWDPASLEAFGGDPAADPAGWARFRRELVNRVVAETHDSIAAVRRVPLSAAVWPIYDRDRFGWRSSSGVAEFYQDTWEWARQGDLDVAAPMTYFYVAERPCSYLPRRPGQEPNPDWACMVADHVNGMKPTGRHVYAAILAGLPFGEMEKQIRIGRERGVNGFAVYSYGALQQTGAWRMLGSGPFRERAVVPKMPWMEETAPEAAN